MGWLEAWGVLSWAWASILKAPSPELLPLTKARKLTVPRGGVVCSVYKK